jgi:hypothetical protein
VGSQKSIDLVLTLNLYSKKAKNWVKEPTLNNRFFANSFIVTALAILF